MKYLKLLIVASLAVFTACENGEDKPAERSDKSKLLVANMKLARDPHTYAEPNMAKVKHLEWDAVVDFDTRIITATAAYEIEKTDSATEIVLDINDLTISSVTVDGEEVEYEIGPSKEFLGSPLVVPLKEDSKLISISYTTAPDAGALLWVEGEKPFLFSQSQAILARTWLPCQDSPGIRYTYNARVQVPTGLLALMSAENPQEMNDEGKYSFKMEQPIPSYLMALAAGDLVFRPVGDRAGVYATPELIDAAEYEFQEMDDMLIAAEELYGSYVWDRYDLLILPPAFPFGGMENPRLTFATPTIIAGDRSLVALVAHELAHSWSGNLVTNSTWDDFWLNEGFTVYFEQRIMESVYGREHSEMLAKLTKQELEAEEAVIRAELPADTKLKLNLEGRNPDDGLTAIPYNKGYFFLRLLEETAGREKFDTFLKNYFTEHSFQVMDTDGFIAYLNANLLTGDLENAVDIDEWIFGEGLPANIPVVDSDRIDMVDEMAANWSAGTTATADIPWDSWVYQERYRFIANIENVDASRLAELNDAYDILSTGNNEVLFVMLKQCIMNDYETAYPKVEEFLVNVGRRKFLTPLYDAMKTTGKMDMALDIYGKARPNYHAVSTGTMDELLGWNETE